MSIKHSVAIFWDYENCRLSCESSGYNVVRKICETAHEYGDVTLLKAYADLKGGMSDRHRTELHCAGVSLTDCPHNGYKEVVDNTLIVDMLTYAIDHPAPATIILISGDRDFVYALSVLRLRRYRVIVIASQSAHTSLVSLASVYLDWQGEILGKERSASKSSDNDSNTSIHHIPKAAESTVFSPLPSPSHPNVKKSRKKGPAKSMPPDLETQVPGNGAPVLIDHPADGHFGEMEGRATDPSDSSSDARVAMQRDMEFPTNARNDDPYPPCSSSLLCSTATNEAPVLTVEQSVPAKDGADAPVSSMSPTRLHDRFEVVPNEPPNSLANRRPENGVLFQSNTPTLEVGISQEDSHVQSFWERCRVTWKSLLPYTQPSPATNLTTSIVVPPPSSILSAECSLVTASSVKFSPHVDSARSSLLLHLGDEGAVATEPAGHPTSQNLHAEAATGSSFTEDHVFLHPVLDHPQAGPVQMPPTGDLVPPLSSSAHAPESRESVAGETSVDPPVPSNSAVSTGTIIGGQPIIHGNDLAMFSSLIKILRERRRLGDMSPKLGKVSQLLHVNDPAVFVRAGLDGKKKKIRRFSALAVAAGIVTFDNKNADSKGGMKRRICLTPKWV